MKLLFSILISGWVFLGCQGQSKDYRSFRYFYYNNVNDALPDKIIFGRAYIEANENEIKVTKIIDSTQFYSSSEIIYNPIDTIIYAFSSNSSDARLIRNQQIVNLEFMADTVLSEGQNEYVIERYAILSPPIDGDEIIIVNSDYGILKILNNSWNSKTVLIELEGKKSESIRRLIENL